MTALKYQSLQGRLSFLGRCQKAILLSLCSAKRTCASEKLVSGIRVMDGYGTSAFGRIVLQKSQKCRVTNSSQKDKTSGNRSSM
jgi:hypothetical protein